jgi:hypothetical protein
MYKKLKDIDKETLSNEHKTLVDNFEKSKKQKKEKDNLTKDFENLLIRYSDKVKIDFIEVPQPIEIIK